MSYQMLSAHRIQIAGGLAIHHIQQCMFSDILKPAAEKLILTGGCLAPGDPINGKFRQYLLENWKQIIYIGGDSETKSEEMNPMSDSFLRLRLQYTKSVIHTVIGISGNNKIVRVVGAANLDHWPVEIKEKQTSWIKQQEFDSPELLTLLVSNGKIPSDSIIENKCIIQGCAEYNNFNPHSGPLTNSRTDFNGLPRSSYRPDFVVELGSPPWFPNLRIMPTNLQLA